MALERAGRGVLASECKHSALNSLGPSRELLQLALGTSGQIARMPASPEASANW